MLTHFMLTLKKLETTCIMRNFNVHFQFQSQFQRTLHYVPNKGTIKWPISCTKGGHISVPSEKTIIGGRLNTSPMGLKNKDFSDKDQCQCMYTKEFFAYIFFIYCIYSYFSKNDQQIK